MFKCLKHICFKTYKIFYKVYGFLVGLNQLKCTLMLKFKYFR